MLLYAIINPFFLFFRTDDLNKTIEDNSLSRGASFEGNSSTTTLVDDTLMDMDTSEVETSVSAEVEAERKEEKKEMVRHKLNILF